MPEVIISKEYNINSDNLLKLMYDEKFIKYISENTEDIDDYNIIKKEFFNDKNMLKVESKTICSIKLPNYIKKFIGNYNSYDTKAKSLYNIKNKTAEVELESFYFKFLLLEIKYYVKIFQSDKNKSIRETKFIFNSGLPLIGYKVNNLIKKIITDKEDYIYKIESEYIEKNKVKIKNL